MLHLGADALDLVALVGDVQLRGRDGSPAAKAISQYRRIFSYHILGEMLGHQVRRVLGAQDFCKFNNTEELLLQEPQHTDVEMANPARE